MRKKLTSRFKAKKIEKEFYTNLHGRRRQNFMKLFLDYEKKLEVQIQDKIGKKRVHGNTCE